MGNFPYIPRSGCEHGRWNCSLQHCPVHGGLSPWSSWSSCSLSCGGLGLKIRTRACSQPAPAHGGRDCQGPRQETTFCQAPQCPGTRTWLSGVLYIKLSLCVETIKRELISTYIVFILFAYRNYWRTSFARCNIILIILWNTFTCIHMTVYAFLTLHFSHIILKLTCFCLDTL